MASDEPYYRDALARVHHEGFGFHADAQMPRRPSGWVGDDLALVIERVSDGPDHFARDHTIFVREHDGRYRREHERHDNVLIDVRAVVPTLLEAEGLHVEVRTSFGTESNMEGLLVVVAHR